MLFKALQELSECMEALSTNTTCNIFSEVLHNPAYENVLGEFEKFFHFLRNHNGSLSQFCMSYMDIVAAAIQDIVNDLIRAHNIGEKCYQNFKEERFVNDQSEKDFYDRLPKA